MLLLLVVTQFISYFLNSSDEVEQMTATELSLKTLLVEFFPHIPIEVTLSENLTQLGGDSIMAAVLASRIHRLWSVKISVKTLLQLKSFDELLAYLPAQIVEYDPQKSRVSTQDVYRQTDSQKMVYLEVFRSPATTAYNIPVVAELPIALSPQMLQNALQKTVKSFPAIFTHFYDIEGEFLFRYYEHSTIPVIRYDNLQQAEQQFVQPFDLKKDCLIRTAIVPFDGHVTIVMLDFSHIIVDGLSIGHFIRQLKATLYQQMGEEIHKTIFDYSRWTETSEYKSKFAIDATFWRNCLNVDMCRPRWLSIPQLPSTKKTLGYGYAIRQAPIDALLAANIRQKAEQNGVTAFTLFLLGWYLLQSVVTDTWNSCVGLVVSGRTEPEYQDTFGMFVNTLLLPLNFYEQTSMQDALNSLAKQTAAVLEHQNYPFSRQVQELKKQQGQQSPLDALFAFQNIDYQRIDIFGGRFRSFHQAKKMAQFGMVIQVFDLAEQGYDIQWEYAPEIYSTNMINSFISHYQSIIRNIANGEMHHSLRQLLAEEVVQESVRSDFNVPEFNFNI